MAAYLLNEPPSLELSCLDFVRTKLDKLEASDDSELAFINAICSLPGPIFCSILEFLGNTGSITDFKLDRLLQAARWTSTPMKRLHLSGIKETVSGVGLLNYSCCVFEEIVLKFDVSNSSQPNLDDLWQAFKGSVDSLEVLKLYAYPMSFADQDHIFSFVSRFPNLKSFCLHTYSKKCEIDSVLWTNVLDSCPSLKEIEIFVPNNKEHITFDSSIFSFGGNNLRSLSLPAMFNSLNLPKLEYGFTGLLDLNTLSHLDLSVDDDPEISSIQVPRAEHITNFMEKLEDANALPNLVSLDVSGMREVHSGHIEKLLKSHKKLKFLGLCLLEVEYTNKASVVESVGVSLKLNRFNIYTVNQ